jgi:hypothetical protein
MTIHREEVACHAQHGFVDELLYETEPAIGRRTVAGELGAALLVEVLNAEEECLAIERSHDGLRAAVARRAQAAA